MGKLMKTKIVLEKEMIRCFRLKVNSIMIIPTDILILRIM